MQGPDVSTEISFRLDSGSGMPPACPLSASQQAYNPACLHSVLAGRPRGFGFVVFESPEVVKKVIESKHTIDKRDVECKIAVPKEEVPTPPGGADASTKTRKIFVGGLAPTVDDQVRHNTCLRLLGDVGSCSCVPCALLSSRVVTFCWPKPHLHHSELPRYHLCPACGLCLCCCCCRAL